MYEHTQIALLPTGARPFLGAMMTKPIKVAWREV